MSLSSLSFLASPRSHLHVIPLLQSVKRILKVKVNFFSRGFKQFLSPKTPNPDNWQKLAQAKVKFCAKMSESVSVAAPASIPSSTSAKCPISSKVGNNFQEIVAKKCGENDVEESRSGSSTSTSATIASTIESASVVATSKTTPAKARRIITGNGVVTNGLPNSKNKFTLASPSPHKGNGCHNVNGGIVKIRRTPSPPNSPNATGGNQNRQAHSTLGTNQVDGSEMSRPKKVYKVVLTGGPCGGKTTGQARLCTFFENLGWKVFRVPEAANILLGGGIKFSELTEDQAFKFQEELLRSMMQIESVFFTLADTINQDVLVICDRGTMDASAFIPREKWEEILRRNNWNEVDIRDTRYSQIIHMVSAANGAEPFYTLEDHASRSEGLDLALALDQKAAQAWVGHPYFDVVDNSTDFEAKVCRMIQSVCQKLGIDARDRLQTNSRKVKYLLKSPLPPDDQFPSGFQDFSVVHDYLQTTAQKIQARLRKRGQKGCWSYTYTERRPEMQGQVVEVKTALTQRDYNNMLSQKDSDHLTVFKTRRCFLLNDQYFQLDIYKEPCHPRCKGLVLLETYSTLSGADLQQRLPSFLTFIKEVTGDPRYSMFNLSLKHSWVNNQNYCETLAASEDDSV